VLPSRARKEHAGDPRRLRGQSSSSRCQISKNLTFGVDQETGWRSAGSHKSSDVRWRFFLTRHPKGYLLTVAWSNRLPNRRTLAGLRRFLGTAGAHVLALAILGLHHILCSARIRWTSLASVLRKLSAALAPLDPTFAIGSALVRSLNVPPPDGSARRIQGSDSRSGRHWWRNPKW